MAGTPCRGSADACDLPEFCNGTGAFCPDDFYIMDGQSCQDEAAYCYEGRCQTYNSQCRTLFAPGLFFTGAQSGLPIRYLNLVSALVCIDAARLGRLTGFYSDLAAA